MHEFLDEALGILLSPQSASYIRSVRNKELREKLTSYEGSESERVTALLNALAEDVPPEPSVRGRGYKSPLPILRRKANGGSRTVGR
jgi:hypothetical protein